MKHETEKERAVRLELEKATTEMARAIASACPPGTGFVLFIADKLDGKPGGNTAYAANIVREDAIKMVREWLARMQ